MTDFNDNSPFQPEYTPFATVSIELNPSKKPAAPAPWLPESAEEARYLEALFPSLIKVTDNNVMHMDQSMLTALIATSDRGPRQCALMTWQEVRRLLKTRELHTHLKLSLDQPLIIVVLDPGFPHRDSIRARYTRIQNYLEEMGIDKAGTTMVYPTVEEAEADGLKLPDIRVLDEVAALQETWRPKTCFGDGECVLFGVRSFNKRSWSGCSTHTGEYIAPTLSCSISGRPASHASPLKEPWFHQEYVEMLSRAEFRVFIVTKPDPKGLRGLCGTILRVCLTQNRSCGGLSACEPTEKKYNKRGLTEEQVHSFALGVFEALRERNDPGLQSLEIGCRLDISAQKNGGPLFVNEITRWYGAHYFSRDCTPAPHHQTCEAYAMAFLRSYEFHSGCGDKQTVLTSTPRKHWIHRSKNEFGAVLGSMERPARQVLGISGL